MKNWVSSFGISSPEYQNNWFRIVYCWNKCILNSGKLLICSLPVVQERFQPLIKTELDDNSVHASAHSYCMEQCSFFSKVLIKSIWRDKHDYIVTQKSYQISVRKYYVFNLSSDYLLLLQLPRTSCLCICSFSQLFCRVNTKIGSEGHNLLCSNYYWFLNFYWM